MALGSQSVVFDYRRVRVSSTQLGSELAGLFEAVCRGKAAAIQSASVLRR
jgi:hypothetical protein